MAWFPDTTEEERRADVANAAPRPTRHGALEKRPRDENGWRVPNEGTRSRRIYDLMRAGTPVAEIATDIGCHVGPYIFNIKNPDYKVGRSRLQRRQERQEQRAAEQAAVAPSSPIAGDSDGASLVGLAEMSDTALDGAIDALRAAAHHLPALERELQYLLHVRLVRDMRKFVKRFDEGDERHIWNSFVGGLINYRADIEQRCDRKISFIGLEQSGQS